MPKVFELSSHMQQSGLGLSGRLSPFAGPASPRKLPTRLTGTKQRPSAVLAPAEVNTHRQKNKDSRSHHPGQSRGLAGVLLSALRVWERQDQHKTTTEDLLVEAAVRGDQASKSEGKTSGKKTPTPPPAIDPFLRPVGVMELRYIRMLSNLSALTYFMNKLTPEAIHRRHGLRLVTSSLTCELNTRQPQMSPLQAMVDGDATAADVSYIMAARQIEQDNPDASSSTVDSPAMLTIAKVEPLVTTKTALPADIVASSLSAAAAAAATAASSAADSVYSAAAPIAAPIASNISAFTSSATTPLASVAAQLQNAAAAGQAGTVATLATVSAAVMSGRTSTDQQQCLNPTEWFVADDAEAHVRYFVIQGSDNLDHWRVNLTFDPMEFEDPALGVKVHRGVYETALLLYDRFLPLVQDHVASSPTARIAFTGHSLGGSLATLLMMMYLRRGVIGLENLAPVYTFGAPAIFCEGATGPCGVGCGTCSIPTGPSEGSASSDGLLEKLGLPVSAVRNVIMHKDIVPRAFACDYSLVADLLRRVGESFREHKCLSGDRRVMFNFVGKMIIVQPVADAKFVGSDGYHAMLPPRPGAYVVREPGALAGVAAQVQRDARVVADAITNLPAGAAASLAVPASAQPKVASADEAVWQLMNTPHPLDILADPGAYGESGSISRYHNPDNYTRAIGGVLRSRGGAWRNIVNRAKQNGASFRPPALIPTRPEHYGPANKEATGGKMHSPLATRPAYRPHDNCSVPATS